MILKKYILFFFVGISILSASAQSQKQYLRKADSYFDRKDYYNALTYYEVAMQMDSSNISVNHRVAEASRFVNDYRTAERFYFKVWVRDNKNEFPQSQYWLGMMQKSNGKYKDAVKSFDRYYRKNIRDSSNYFTKKSKLEKDACEWAVEQVAHPAKVRIHHLDTNINSIHSEFGFAMNDTDDVYFSSLRGQGETTIYTGKNYSRIYHANGHDTTWTYATLADSIITSYHGDIGNVAFGEHFSTIYFTLLPAKKSKKLLPGIYSSEIKKGKFSTPSRLGNDINLEGTFNSQPCIGRDSTGKELLFFVSDRPGGFGKLDIWFCKRTKGGTYSKPINAGRFVNTADDEVSPYYNDSTHRLYFSSTYHKGMGGFDIFSSSWSDSLLTYGEPQNPGYPINTAANDLYFVQRADTSKGYFASNRIGSLSVYGETCCNDIYAFDYPPVPRIPVLRDTLELIPMASLPSPEIHKQEILDKIKLLVPLTLYFNNDEPDPRTKETSTKKSYEETYLTYLAQIQKYKNEYAKGLKGAEKEKAEHDIDNFFNLQLKAGFDGLEKFAALMLENLEEGRTVSITLKGYCSPLASTDYNKNLAKRRVVSLKNYFMTYGNGVFLEYMSAVQPTKGESKGRIVITEEDVGETEATEASDNVQDQRNSIYSRKAALERKIQIIAISAKEGK